MQLPRGITGFFKAGQPKHPSIDLPAFKSACYAAARSCGATVEGFATAESEIVRNFHAATLRRKTERFVILCNAYHPFVAFAYHPFVAFADPQQTCFFDDSTLASAFVPTFQVLTEAELNLKIDATTIVSLDPAEVEQIRYWKPKHLHQVIFNEWD